MSGYCAKVRARVVAFDRSTCWGTAVYDLSPVNYHSTSFHGRDWPRVGERVEIQFTAMGSVLSVWPIEETP